MSSVEHFILELWADYSPALLHFCVDAHKGIEGT